MVEEHADAAKEYNGRENPVGQPFKAISNVQNVPEPDGMPAMQEAKPADGSEVTKSVE